ncbi:NADH dehydrogenase [ubiquinone] 1 beta subcomplex subunit 7-like [Dreissena polymorpha]|uniref:NADH dehydrogenase [ubiquinone] 1 beta subcomplex subunit 7 n=1 Tax=Dreissena polymorpha TaxID=45954 RepID=A0A9D3Y9U3_DREPO|nr:NADH dehydrogenase [ubiquinone] 1 beta subcomplex subunit 7-like [Dreissena polymorpha]XP_052256613.1 NADH dehydrogenase [ubiquinone] 1 beta subcomplex subunit 7-like [Dreissena polymorpha]KAH3694886.1 hypothetical protein DPMN_082328 [Dreissena polymorpha]KAH3695023.1 hypothetical protein DPMN_082471 [Dreissena polymorpha]
MGIAYAKFQEMWPDPRQKMPSQLEVDFRNGPTFDPMLGFPNGRKEREMPLTHDEMVDARLPFENRDYCAHKYVHYLQCMTESGFFAKLAGKCDHDQHEYNDCMKEDTILRWKEWERERRLLERRKRRIAKGLEPDPSLQTQTA